MQNKKDGIVNALNHIFSRKEKLYLLYVLFIVLVGAALELLGVAVFTPFIEAFTNSDAIWTNSILSFIYTTFGFGNISEFILGMASGIIVIYIVKNVFLTYEKNAVYKFSYGMQQRVAGRLINAYLRKPYVFHLKTNPAELVRTIQVDADNLCKTVIHVIELVTELIVCASLVIYLFIVSPMITIITAAFLFVFVSIYIFYTKERLRRLGKRNQAFNGECFKYLNQSFGGIKEIKVLGREDYFVRKYSYSLAQSVRCLRLSRLASVLPKYFVESVCIVGLMLAVIIEVKTNNANIDKFVPQLAVFATAAFRLMPSVGRINEHTAAINTNSPSIMLIYNDLLDVGSASKSIPQKLSDGNRLSLDKGIKVENIVFGYPDSDKNVINDVSFCIPKGKTVAFIGESGAGKTTMADIILGVLEPQNGRILADSDNVFDNLEMWHENIGYIPQVIYLSDDTIRNNIAFGIDSKEIDEKAVIEAARKAQILDFINSLPDGLDTVVGERGARISGGQRQRIGIARALYHDPEILVLDEATSALDNETETAVMEAIDGLHGVKTMIIIAHRLTTIKNADIVIEIGGGKAVLRDKEEVVR